MDDEQDGWQDQGANDGMTTTNNRGGGGGGGEYRKKKGPCAGECIRRPKVPIIGVRDVKNPRFGTMLFGEVLGTFFLVFMGCGSVKAYGGTLALITAPTIQQNSSMNTTTTYLGRVPTVTFAAGQQAVMIAFAFGITVACIAQAIGHVSGAHLNPAVSFGLVVSGQCSFLQALCYTLAQILGALLASLLLFLTTFKSYNPVTKKVVDTQWNLAVSLPSVPPFDAFIMEIFLTFLLVLVVCGVCDDLRKDIKGSAPLAIGLTVFVCHVTGMQYSGSSINPARSIGPLLFPARDQAAAANHIWIYIFGPLIGGMEAGFTYHVFFREKESTSDIRSVEPA